MDPEDFEIEDDQPIAVSPSSKDGDTASASAKSDDDPLPKLKLTKIQSHIEAPKGVTDLTTPNSQAPNPHKGNAGLDENSPVSGFFKLYKWHPFTELFCVIAEWFEPLDHDISQRDSFAQKHGKLFRFAIFADFLVLTVIVLGILAAIAYVALQTVGIEIDVIKIPIPWLAS